MVFWVQIEHIILKNYHIFKKRQCKFCKQNLDSTFKLNSFPTYLKITSMVHFTKTYLSLKSLCNTKWQTFQ